MSLDPTDFRTLDIKANPDKSQIEIHLEAIPYGLPIWDKESSRYTHNPNFKKWRVKQVKNYLVEKGHHVEKCISTTRPVICNGDLDLLESIFVFELKKETKTSKNEKPKTTAKISDKYFNGVVSETSANW